TCIQIVAGIVPRELINVNSNTRSYPEVVRCAESPRESKFPLPVIIGGQQDSRRFQAHRQRHRQQVDESRRGPPTCGGSPGFTDRILVGEVEPERYSSSALILLLGSRRPIQQRSITINENEATNSEEFVTSSVAVRG